jgi:hypothetical protein
MAGMAYDLLIAVPQGTRGFGHPGGYLPDHATSN